MARSKLWVFVLGLMVVIGAFSVFTVEQWQKAILFQLGKVAISMIMSLFILRHFHLCC